ncbi:hypothetical protein AGABI2DRAFT_56440, partial [Agaricus bisporus var. bisporus H97]|uniref:hypothetical protein n=1 Tax=Agaricus bisporus var. bisporus (strain H97 / ATCC MYA-4626 / FGSC 10389) TaxID=936046 RepID=UPI00029F784E
MSQNTPPIFPDTDKFDGTNWVAWSGLINIAADLRGVSDYLEGTIPQPSSSRTTAAKDEPAPSTDTSWESHTPTPAEWKIRNAWAKGLLIYNTKDPIGLGIALSGTAAEAWKSYKDQ